MERRAELQRRTGLRRTPLSRGGSTLTRTPLNAGRPLTRRAPLTGGAGLTSRTPLAGQGRLNRSAPLRQRSDKRITDDRVRAVVVAQLRAVQVAICGFTFCERCGRRGEVHGHEKLGRSQGGDPTQPDALLCNICNRWCEDNPIAAAATGWKISRKHPMGGHQVTDTHGYGHVSGNAKIL